MVCMALSPLLVLEKLEKDLRGEVVGLEALLLKSKDMISLHSSTSDNTKTKKQRPMDSKNVTSDVKKKEPPAFERNDVIRDKKTVKKKTNVVAGNKQTKEEVPLEKTQKKKHYEPTEEELSLARGVSGLPFEETPALIGARRGHIKCDVNVDDLAYWNNPQGLRDDEFVTHFKEPTDRYISFEPDPGGWNNIRMSMEVIFVLAAATGRTLVLPPRAPMYLLGDGSQNARSFGNFFPINEELKKKVNVITMEEFIVTEGKRLLSLNATEIENMKSVADICVHQPPEKDKRSCEWLFPLLRKRGIQPQMEASHHCLVFDNDVFDKGANLTADQQKRVDQFCGDSRTQVLYTRELHNPKLIHWQAANLTVRLLNHFYAFTYFTDTAVDNYYKRFVRDFLHYKDELYCAAGKIIHSLQQEQGEFSTLHIRRGDLQYKEVKFSAAEWYNNTRELWKPNETLYIATDERNKSWFDDLAKHHKLRFLDDYWDYAKLGELDSSFIGMVDTIVASQGRVFAGTWFSTFSGFINRLRGYYGYSMKDSWYSYLPRKTIMHPFEFPHGNFHTREFHSGWVGIDGDETADHERELPILSGEPSVANRTVSRAWLWRMNIVST